MPTVNTELKAPCTQDRAILAVQDFVNSIQWPVLELSTSRVVLKGPGVTQQQLMGFPVITLVLKESVGETTIAVAVSSTMPYGMKKHLVGIMGQIVNGISIRVQTQSIAINPTVALGEGQGEASTPRTDRLDQLERLQKLFESGILTPEEFDAEKQKILKHN
jgi:hypothetical protein